MSTITGHKRPEYISNKANQYRIKIDKDMNLMSTVLTITVTCLSLLTGISMAGQPPLNRKADSLNVHRRPSVGERQQRINGFYRRSLGVDSLKAAEVERIMAEYKQAMGALESGRSAQDKNLEIRRLMSEKNRRLSLILSPEQLSKIVPPSELERTGTERKQQ